MKISVITPFYNGNRFLPDYFDNIAQNVSNLLPGDELEVIIVNDSPWETVSVPDVDIHGAGVRVMELPENAGIHNARVRGLAEASGEWIMFLDQDDQIAEDALRVLGENAKKAAADVVVSNAVLEQQVGREIWYRTDYHKKLVWDLDTYIKVGTQIMSPGQTLIRREAIPSAWCEHILTHNCCDDYYLWLLMLAAGRRAIYVDEPLYIHRYTGENASRDIDETEASTLEMIDYLKLSLDSTNKSKVVIDTIEKMTAYKSAFRRSGSIGRIILSLGHPSLFAANVIYKAKTRTPLGFNR